MPAPGRRSWSLVVTCFVLALSMLYSAGSAAQADLQLNSKSAILMDASTGQIFYEHNSHQVLPPASVTKVMTLLVALEALHAGEVALDDLITTSPRARSMGGTQIWLEVGEQMVYKDLLYAIAVGSANDASVAVAEHLAGSEAAFAERMNQRARELGARNTNFSNASGLPPEDVGMSGRDHVTSAYDLAVISRHAVQVPMFMELVSTYGPYDVRPGTNKRVELWNLNSLLRFYPGMDGIKTGMTQAAGYCLSATAKRDGLRLIAITLGAPTKDQRSEDIRALLNYGFSRYQAHEIIRKGAEVGVATIRKGEEEQVRLLAAEDLYITVPRGETVAPQQTMLLADPPVAPVREGQPLGHLIARLNGEEAGRVPLIAGDPVERGSVFTLIVRTTRRLMGSFFPVPEAGAGSN